jgi:hypothetical protein
MRVDPNKVSGLTLGEGEENNGSSKFNLTLFIFVRKKNLLTPTLDLTLIHSRKRHESLKVARGALNGEMARVGDEKKNDGGRCMH